MIYAENILICIAAPALISMIFIKGNARLYTAFFCIGMLVCLISAYINGFFSLQASLGTEGTSIYIAPVVEEIMKFLPLLFYLLMFEPKKEEIFMAAIAVGVGFATLENCCYILTSGAERITYVLVRGFSVGVMHVVSVLALALGLLLIMWIRIISFSAIIGVLSLSATFHALYNLMVSRGGAVRIIGYIFPTAIAVVLYLPYKNIRGLINKEHWIYSGEKDET